MLFIANSQKPMVRWWETQARQPFFYSLGAGIFLCNGCLEDWKEIYEKAFVIIRRITASIKELIKLFIFLNASPV
jgi:hypothetical protein